MSKKVLENNKIKQKVKKTKKKILYPRGQFWFIVISLSVWILVCLFIGGRSIYYYSKQHYQEKKEANTLATVIKKNSSIVESGDGLYKVNQEYLFKGKSVNNYVKYSNRMFRIVKINEDNSVQLVSDDNQTIIVWGDEINYENSNLYKYLNKQEDVEHTGLFYESLNQPDKYLTKISWCEGKIVDNKLTCQGDEKEDYVSMLTAVDYSNALGVNSYLNDNTSSWLLGLDAEGSNTYLSETGSITSGLTYDGYGVKPVITVKSNINIVSGDGTVNNPYTIETEEDKGKVGGYVKLGEDLYQVISEDEMTLTLSLNNYLQVNGVDYEINYSNSTTMFDINDRKNIGYYLNNKYLNSLSYQDKLNECIFYTGEISDEVGYNYLNVYQNQISSKVGMLNMVDLKLNNNLTDYFMMNTTSSLGEMAWTYDINGELHEAIITDKKKIVPVVCISKDKIISGNGSMDTPFVME